MIFRLAVLGDPVAHSRSPSMHTAGLAAAGLDGTYRAIRATADEMVEYAHQVRSGELTGANITMPHKAVAASLADELTDRAARAGSVNTWFSRERRLVGDSTDVPGIIEAMDLRGVSRDLVLVLGTGGAAAAALVALEGSQVFVSGRRPARAEALVESVGVEASVVGWGIPVEQATVVNATPLGMRGEELPEPVLDHAGGLFDMAYGDQPTPAVARARRTLGIPLADGIDLLVAQAELSFELWTGRRPPSGLFEEEARNVSSR